MIHEGTQQNTQLHQRGRTAVLCGAFVCLILGFFFVSSNEVHAAEVLIDSTAQPTTTNAMSGAPTAVCVDDSRCFSFYLDLVSGAGGQLSMASSTDGGVTWTAGRNVDSVNTADVVGVAIWWEGWTHPGTSTQYIHIATTDTSVDDTYYTRYDITNNTFSTTVLGTTQAATCTLGSSCYPAITMASNGDLFMTAADTSDRWVVKCAATSTCTTASNWFEVANGYYGGLGDDYPLLAPMAGTNNVMLVWWDISLDDILYNVYSATTTSWVYTGAASGTLSTAAEDNTTYDVQLFGISVSTSTGKLALVYTDDTNNYTAGQSDHDIQFWTYATATSWVAGTNPTTTAAGGLTGAKVAYDERNDVWYVVYGRRSTINTSTTGNVYYVTSSDGGTTWSTESATAVNDNADDIRSFSVNITSFERIGLWWTYETAPRADTAYFDNVVDITAGGGGGGTTLYLSGTLYSDEGTTPMSSALTLGVAIGTTTTSVSATTSLATTGAWNFTVPSGHTVGTSTPILVWLDGYGTTTSGAVFTKASSTNSTISGLDLYQNRLIVRHEGTTGTSTTLTDLGFYSSTNDSDIQYTATTTNGSSLSVSAYQKLYIWNGKTFVASGTVTVNGNASTTSQTDGSLHLATSSTFITTGTTTLAGSFTASTSATFTHATSALLFTATTTGKTINAALSTLGTTTFDGSGGEWTFGTTSTTSNLTASSGTLYLPDSNLTITGDYTNNNATVTALASIWTPRSASEDNDGWFGIAYGNGVFVAVGWTADRVMYSYDGITWTTGDAVGNDDGWNDIAFGNGRFVAVADCSVSGDCLMHSTDGIAWATSSVAGNNDTWNAVTYGAGKWVAVGSSGDRVMYSSDGITWATTSAAGNNDGWYDVIFGGGVFVAVGNSGDYVMTSYDGITWTARSAAGDDDQWRSVAYGTLPYSLLPVFVVVGDATGGADSFMYSIDAVNWATSTMGGDNEEWNDVQYVDGRFVAVSAAGDARERVMVSFNGETWLDNPAGSSTSAWQSLTYGNDKLVAVGSGPTNFVMTSNIGTTTFNSASAQTIFEDSVPTLFGNVRTLGAGTKTFLTSFGFMHDLTIESGSGALTAPGYLLSIGGDYKNSGTFTANGGTVVLNGAGEQVATGTMTGTSAWSTLYVLNTHTSTSTTFGSSFEVSDTLGTLAAGIKLAFAPGVTATVTTMNFTSGAPSSTISLRSSTAGSQYYFVVTGSYTIDYVDVKDSNACASVGGGITVSATNTDSGNNTCWTFGAGGGGGGTILLSGTLYSDEGVTPITSALTLGIAIGTSTPSVSASTSLASGAWNFTVPSGHTVGTSTPILVWLDGYGSTTSGALFTKASSTNSTISGLDIYQNRLIIRHEGTGTSTTLNDLSFYNSAQDSDIQYIATSTNGSSSLIVSAHQKLYIWPSKTFVASGTVEVRGNASSTSRTDGSLHLATSSTLIVTGTTTLAGSFTASTSATFTHATSALLFNATTTGKTINAALSSLGTTTFDGAGGRWSFGTTSTTSNFTVSTGTLNLPQTTLTVTGNFTNNGTIYGGGANWVAQTPAQFNQWWYVAYGNGLFVAISTNGTNRVMTSPDGVTWTARSAAGNDDPWYSVTYGGGRFVAVGHGAVGDAVMTSLDGITWATTSAAGDNDEWYSVTYGNGLFVAVGFGPDRVMTSPDGLTWSVRSAAEANNWFAVTYGNGRFVAVAQTGTNQVMYSEDGISWSPAAASEANTWNAITYGNGLFVAVSSDGTNRVMTSPDGITWTPRSAAANRTWEGVIYGGGRFVAVADAGATRVMTSPDGITWTSQDAAITSGWFSVAYGNGRYIAVSGDGDVMSSNVSTTSFAGAAAQTILGNLTGTSTLDSVTFSGAGTKTFSSNASTSNFVINSGSGAVTAPSHLTIYGDYQNSGTFTAGSGTTTFAGTDVQIATGTMTGSSAFNNVAVTGGGVGPTTDGLVGYWTMDYEDAVWQSSTVGTSTDMSGKGNHASFENMASSTNTVSGRFGNAMSFNGFDEYLTAPDSPSLDLTGEFTIGAWIYTDGSIASNGFGDLVTKALFNDGSLTNYWLLISDVSGVEYVGIDMQNGVQSGGSRSTTALTPNQWHHVVATYNDAADTIIYYVDGVSDTGTLNWGTDPKNISATANDYPLRIGWAYGGQAFPGKIDEVRIYNRALTPSEISGIYSASWYAKTFGTNASTTNLSVATGTTMEAQQHLSISGQYNNAGLYTSLSTTTFNGTSAQVATGTMTGSSAFNHLGFSGRGAKSFATNASTSNLLIESTATVTLDKHVSIAGNYTNNGSFVGAGTNWTSASASEANEWWGLTYGNGLFVAVSAAGTNQVMTSPDGITWTARSASEAAAWNEVTFGNGLFVAVGETGSNRIMTSPDGITWTSRTAPELNTWEDVVWGGGRFVAISANGTNRVMTSPDGITWTARATAGVTDQTWHSIAYGNGLFVVAAISAGTNAIMTSPDGITWTARNATGNDDRWTSVTYGNGLFVAVGDCQIASECIMTSPDGITWTVRNQDSNDKWMDVTFGNGKFVAIACGYTACGDNSHPLVTISSDGITWYGYGNASLSGSNSWNNIAYGNGRFVVTEVSAAGVVMVSTDATTTFNGLVPQTLSGNLTGTSSLRGVGFTGTGTKTFASNASTTNLTITASSGPVVAPSYLSISGNYTNAGTFTAGSGTTTLAGSVAQTATGTMTGTSAWNNLVVANTHTSTSTTFGANLTASKLQNTVAGSKIAFAPGTGATTTTLVLTGAASNTVALRSTTAGSQSYIAGTGSYTISYVDVKDNSACGSVGGGITFNTGTTTGNTTCWNYITGASLSSLASQTFAVGQATTSASQMTIAEQSTPAITSANDIRIKIATSTVRMKWDTTDTSVTLGGTASGKVSGTVSYEGSGSVLVLDVTSNFAANDTLTISGLSFAQFTATNSATVALSLYDDGAADTSADTSSDKTITITGSLTVSDHSSGQVSDAFTTPSATDLELFRFRMAPSGETFTISSLVLNLVGIAGIDSGDLTNAELYRDMNSDGLYDAGDVQIGGAGAVSISGQTGTLTWSTSFAATTTLDYVVALDTANMKPGDFLTARLTASGITAVGDLTSGTVPYLSTVTSIQHSRGGGGSDGGHGGGRSIGGDAPAGQGVQGGGGEGGGGDIDTDTGGTSLGNSPGFESPGGYSLGDWSDSSNAVDSDGNYASAASTNLTQSYLTYGFGIPGGNTITGVEVKLEASALTAAGTIEVALSWDGGSSLTSYKSTPTLTTTDTIYTIGSPGDTWGRSWTVGETSDDNFHVILRAQPSGNTVQIDAIRVRVYHQATGGGGGGGGMVYNTEPPYRSPFASLLDIFKRIGTGLASLITAF